MSQDTTEGIEVDAVRRRVRVAHRGAFAFAVLAVPVVATELALRLLDGRQGPTPSLLVWMLAVLVALQGIATGVGWLSTRKLEELLRPPAPQPEPPADEAAPEIRPERISALAAKTIRVVSSIPYEQISHAPMSRAEGA